MISNTYINYLNKIYNNNEAREYKKLKTFVIHFGLNILPVCKNPNKVLLDIIKIL